MTRKSHNLVLRKQLHFLQIRRTTWFWTNLKTLRKRLAQKSKSDFCRVSGECRWLTSLPVSNYLLGVCSWRGILVKMMGGQSWQLLDIYSQWEVAFCEIGFPGCTKAPPFPSVQGEMSKRTFVPRHHYQILNIFIASTSSSIMITSIGDF